MIYDCKKEKQLISMEYLNGGWEITLTELKLSDNEYIVIYRDVTHLWKYKILIFYLFFILLLNYAVLKKRCMNFENN